MQFLVEAGICRAAWKIITIEIRIRCSRNNPMKERTVLRRTSDVYIDEV
jgi:hypothetical protein